jgi:hypothetical protein
MKWLVIDGLSAKRLISKNWTTEGAGVSIDACLLKASNEHSNRPRNR